MSGDDHTPLDTAVTPVADEAQQPEAPPDPLTQLVARFRSAVERGDFKRARSILEQDGGALDAEGQRELAGQRDRLRPDRAAVITAAVCGLILIILAATTLFH